MLTFIARRLLSIPPLLIGVSLLTFCLLRMAPGDFWEQKRMDPSSSLESVLAEMRSAGMLKLVPHDEMVALGEFPAKGYLWTFAADGPVTRRPNPDVPEPPEGSVESMTLSQAGRQLARFNLEGDRYECDEKGTCYVRIGPIEGYVRWAGHAIRLDFGRSYSKNRPVFGLIGERLWNTLKLSVVALTLAWGSAVPLGVIAAVRPNSKIDYAVGLLAFFGLSIPRVFFALLMILFASWTGLFPIGGMRSLDWENLPFLQRLWDSIHHLILPAIVIATSTMAGYMRQARGNMIETLNQNYIRTARAKGLAENVVLYKHALRNAINPLVTLFGFSIAYLLTGSFLVEVVMNWPGMARLVVDAVFARDEPIVMASVLMGSVLLVLGNLVADILLGIFDPRVRLS